MGLYAFEIRTKNPGTTIGQRLRNYSRRQESCVYQWKTWMQDKWVADFGKTENAHLRQGTDIYATWSNERNIKRSVRRSACKSTPWEKKVSRYSKELSQLTWEVLLKWSWAQPVNVPRPSQIKDWGMNDWKVPGIVEKIKHFSVLSIQTYSLRLFTRSSWSSPELPKDEEVQTRPSKIMCPADLIALCVHERTCKRLGTSLQIQWLRSKLDFT